MNPRSLLAVHLGAVALFSAFVCGGAVQGAEWKAPRTADGHPDLQGTWTNGFATPLERPKNLADKPYFTEEEAAAFEKRVAESPAANNDVVSDPTIWWEKGVKVVPSLRTSIVIDPAEGRIPPLTPEAQKKTADIRAENRKHPDWGPEDRSLQERCIVWPSGGPIPMLPSPYNNNYQVVQTPDYLMIEIEMVHDLRIIPIDGGKPASNVRQWLGESHAHWEGDVLVVETTNFTEKTRFRGSDENLRVTERFSRQAPNILLYQFTIEDPTAFTKPWTGEIPMATSDGPMYEFACHEGNDGLRNELRNARLAERQKTAAAQ